MNEYLAYSLFIAGGILALSRIVGDNLSREAKDELSLYLMGEYEKSWPELFCQRFDSIFGKKHFSLRCFLISCLCSMLFVFAIYFLFGPVFGLLEQRTGSRYSFAEILLMGMLINFIPDYLSLFETRWLLNRFKQNSSSLGIALLLLTDIFISAMIILPTIVIYYYATDSSLSLAHTVAAFSVTAIFFYSTFLTSIWAWLFGLSIFFLRLFRKTSLHKLLDVEEKANRSIGIVAASLVLIVGVLSATFTYPSSLSQKSSVSSFDRLMCDWFAETCDNVAELTQDKLDKMEFIIKGCAYQSNTRCVALSNEQFNKKDFSLAAKLVESRCAAGDFFGCTKLGALYYYGLGVKQDYTEAHRLYQQSCEGGQVQGCTKLGALYYDGLGVKQDYTEAHRLYQQGCEGGNALGCNNLGVLYHNGLGVKQDYTEARRLFQQGCEGGNALSCTNLDVFRLLNKKGLDVEQKNTEAPLN
jgi:hypothetical protein